MLIITLPFKRCSYSLTAVADNTTLNRLIKQITIGGREEKTDTQVHATLPSTLPLTGRQIAPRAQGNVPLSFVMLQYSQRCLDRSSGVQNVVLSVTPDVTIYGLCYDVGR